MKKFRQGAEAVLSIDELNGRKVVVKERAAKAYRHPQIDRRLRGERLRAEARLFQEARRAGIRVPVIYDIDERKNKIVMEFIDGRQAKEFINDPAVPEEAKASLAHEIGRLAGRLHSRGIVHGDLTTSNILVPKGCFESAQDETGECISDGSHGPGQTAGNSAKRDAGAVGGAISSLCLIDLSMGAKGADEEKMGVDLHLLKEAFQSAHSERFGLFEEVKKGYLHEFPGGDVAIAKVADIEKRGRYT